MFSRIIFGCVVLLVMGLFFIFMSVASKLREIRQASWPQVDALVVKSEITHGRTNERGDEYRSSGFRWVLFISYEYSVEGKTFVGNKITNEYEQLSEYDSSGFDFDKAPSEKLTEIQGRYPENKKIKVHYNPLRFGDSYIYFERAYGFVVSSFLIGVFLVLISFILFKVQPD